MPQLKEFNVTMKPENNSVPVTREQLMAAERDAKRRRIKHRSAKVHTKSKNYSEVLREVIRNQMEGYEDWVRENFGNTTALESDEPEKKYDEEAKQEKQEMVWLDWGFRGNPHLQWKQILEKEKRRKERDENDFERTGNNLEKDRDRDKHERKRDREESSSRRYDQREKLRKSDNSDKLRRHKYHEEAKYSGRRRDRFEREDSEKRNESLKKGSHHSGHRRDKCEEEHSRTQRHNRDRNESEYKSKYKERYESKYKERYQPKYDNEYKPKYKEKNESRDDPTGRAKRLEYHRDKVLIKVREDATNMRVIMKSTVALDSKKKM